MTNTRHKPDPATKGRPYLEECDIGSGEKTPAQIETEKMISEIPPLPPRGRQGDTGGAQQSGQDQQQGTPEGSRQAVKP
jgi:hypothetical protein